MISDQLIKLLSASCQLSTRQTLNALKLLEEGSTIPFISRYRKEATGGMDEVQLADLKEQYDKLCELAKRKATVLKSIEEQDKLTPELQKRIEECWNSSELE
ncbi:MAG TPA: Tex-like N-terminal domain-containing protein, partial [Paludibacteraceae bacterium]|nr:Tex-like N-terminal domain-containing protein [Paludibacteraceae bacterium]